MTRFHDDLMCSCRLCGCVAHRVPLDRFPAGKYVDIKDTISGFKGVLDGKYDDLPEVSLDTCHEQSDIALQVIQQCNFWVWMSSCGSGANVLCSVGMAA